MTGSLPLLYTELASWFHLLTRPEDYAEEAGIFTCAIRTRLPDARTMLELGSGGGNNASHLKQHFAMTLVDLAPAMLDISRPINPGIPHYQGDMRSFRLDRLFDVVFIHDAIMYLTTEDDLRMAFETAFIHTRPGGLVLIVPDDTRDTFQPSTIHGGHDENKALPAGQISRSLRYLEWTYDPDPSDTNYTVDFTYLLKEAPDNVKCIYDRHICGLFSQETWLRLLSETGFMAQSEYFVHSEVASPLQVFLGEKPG